MHKISLLLLLIAFVAITSNFVIVESSEQIERGKNYDLEFIAINPDNSETYKYATHHERILKNGDYMDYSFSDNWILNRFHVETEFGSVALDKSSCTFSFYNRGFIDWFELPLFSDSIIARMANNGSDVWSDVSQINNAPCLTYWTGSELVAKKYAANVGLMEYKYILNDGKWKTQLEATNLSSLTNKKFSMIQFIDLYRDVVYFGGQQRNLDNFDGYVFGINWIDNNESKIIDFMNDFYFDFDVAHSNLKSITVYDTGENKSRLSFDFARNVSVIMPNDTLIFDPSFTPTSATGKRIFTDGLASSACSTSGHSLDTADGLIFKRDSTSASSGSCHRNHMYFDITALPDSAIITNSSFIYGISGSSGMGSESCIFTPMTTTSGDTALNRWNDIATGTAYVTTTKCRTNAGTSGYDDDLGASADSDFTSIVQSGINEIGFGIKFLSDVRPTGFSAQSNFIGNKLVLTYVTTPRPDAVTDLIANAINTTAIFLDWSEPNLNGESLLGYQINGSTSNPPTSVIVNNTGTSTSEYTHGSLLNGTTYYYCVSAWTLGGNNASCNIASATTSNAPAPDAVTDLIASSINMTAMFLDWSEPNLNGESLLGYIIKYGTTSPPSSTLVLNTGNSITNYNASGLPVDTLFYFRVSAITTGGYNLTGNIASNSTGDPAQPVKDWMNLITGDLNMDDAFGLDMGIAALVVLFGVALATKNIVYGSVLFGVIIGFAVFFGLVAIPAVILSTIVFFIILIIFSARKPSLD